MALTSAWLDPCPMKANSAVWSSFITTRASMCASSGNKATINLLVSLGMGVGYKCPSQSAVSFSLRMSNPTTNGPGSMVLLFFKLMKGTLVFAYTKNDRIQSAIIFWNTKQNSK